MLYGPLGSTWTPVENHWESIWIKLSNICVNFFPLYTYLFIDTVCIIILNIFWNLFETFCLFFFFVSFINIFVSV